jgi:predicted secreted protein
MESLLLSGSGVYVFLDGAPVRIQRLTSLFGGVAVCVVSLICGWPVGLSLLIGIALGALNFNWLVGGGIALLARIQEETENAVEGTVPKIPGSGWAIWRFVLRYMLIGAVCCAIFFCSFFNRQAFLIGLLVPVASLLVEAVLEISVCLRKGW